MDSTNNRPEDTPSPSEEAEEQAPSETAAGDPARRREGAARGRKGRKKAKKAGEGRQGRRRLRREARGGARPLPAPGGGVRQLPQALAPRAREHLLRRPGGHGDEVPARVRQPRPRARADHRRRGLPQGRGDDNDAVQGHPVPPGRHGDRGLGQKFDPALHNAVMHDEDETRARTR